MDLSNYVYSPRLRCMLCNISSEEVEKAIDKHFSYIRGLSQGVRMIFENICFPEGTLFRFAQLKGARFRKCQLDNVDFRGAILEEVVFEDCSIKNSKFDNADFKKASFIRCSLLNLNYEHARNFNNGTNYFSCSRRKDEPSGRYRFTIKGKGNTLIITGDTSKEISRRLIKKGLLPPYTYSLFRREMVLRKNHGSYYDFIKNNGKFSQWKATRFFNNCNDLTDKEDLALILDLLKYKNETVELAEFKENEGRYINLKEGGLQQCC